jgi:2-keto-3-deoxy-L-rhamnonate aldolase RhmA
LGLPTYPSVSEVPGPVDLAVITTPATTVPGVLRECIEKGIKGAVVISAGFAEVGEEGGEIQHAMDEGALVIVIPTVRTFDEGVAGRDWTYFPPLGKRSQGAGQAYSAAFWGDVPGGYRNTINDNVVLIEMIETVGGAAQAREIASIPGVDALFAASTDLGNFSGFRQGDPDYERLINVVHDAALAAGKRLCGPLAWRDRPDFTCFQAGSETAAIAKGVAAELGDLKDTQGKPEVGPYAKP